MRILVLGGSGLISQEIVHQLVALGDQVAVLNRGRTAADLPDSVERLTGDRGTLGGLRPWISQRDIDCLIDMIGYTAEEAAGLVELTRGAVEHVIYCSTVDVFQKPQPCYPVRETAARGARDTFPYAVGKVESELLLEQAAADGDFQLTILRPAQTYGGPAHGPVHPLGHPHYHLWRIGEQRPIFLHGDATSMWSACHARDVAAAFAAAVHEPRSRGRSYNLASPELVTWQRYWEIAGEIFTGRTPAVVTVPSAVLSGRFGEDATWLMENFRFNNIFDCQAAADELGFAPQTSLHDGMAETAARLGRNWLEQGAWEVGSDYDRRYEKTLEWWRAAADTDAMPVPEHG